MTMAYNDLLPRLLKSPPIFFAIAITFIASGLIINILQLFLYVCVRPINKRIFRQLFYYTSYWLISQFVFVGEWWGGMDIVCHVDQETKEKYFGKEHACCILNHCYEIDWLCVYTLCDRIKILGNCKAFAKKAISYTPIVGWSAKLGENVFLARNWDEDKKVIGQQVSELVEFPSAMWLILPAEGTRFTPAKHEVSMKFAREKGLPQLKHHLLPRTKGFTHTVPFLRGKIDAIYDVQLAFKQGVFPTIMGLLKGEKYEAHFYINRIEIETLPEGEEALSNWMRKLYQKKDKMADSFLNTGDFFKESGVKEVPAHNFARRCCSLINALTWTAITLVPISFYLTRLLMSGSLLYISFVVGAIAMCAVFVAAIIQMTRKSSSSTYGTSTSRAKVD